MLSEQRGGYQIADVPAKKAVKAGIGASAEPWCL